jgi:hypothetical protein
MPRSFVSFPFVLPAAFSLIRGVSQSPGGQRMMSRGHSGSGDVKESVPGSFSRQPSMSRQAKNLIEGDSFAGRFVRSVFDLCSFRLPLMAIPG